MAKKIFFNDQKAWETWGCDKVQEIADAIYSRIDEEEVNDANDLEDAIMEALNDELIYYSQQWTILEFYCLPSEANYDEAIEEFISDLFNVINFRQGEGEY